MRHRVESRDIDIQSIEESETHSEQLLFGHPDGLLLVILGQIARQVIALIQRTGDNPSPTYHFLYLLYPTILSLL